MLDRYSAALLLLGVLAFSACHTEPYVLPVPDGGPRPSPPSLAGRILIVAAGEITVEQDAAEGSVARAFRVRIGSSTEIFTQYGGYVAQDELRPGQHASVWYPTRVPRQNPPTAAVVMLDSTEPGGAHVKRPSNDKLNPTVTPPAGARPAPARPAAYEAT